MKARFRKRAARAALVLALAPAGATTAIAQQAVSLDSSVYVERIEDKARVLSQPTRLAPGDRVVTVLTWRRQGAGERFTLTNPLPRGVTFEQSADATEEVSVDGGRSWGRLGSLRAGDHLATPEDVTHLRWRIVSSRTEGRIAYSAIVR